VPPRALQKSKVDVAERNTAQPPRKGRWTKLSIAGAAQNLANDTKQRVDVSERNTAKPPPIGVDGQRVG